MTKRLTDEELAEIKERAEKATEGPWRDDKFGQIIGENDKHIVGAYVDEHDFPRPSITRRDAEFIAHAREDIPKLLAEIERLKSKYDHLKIYIENSEATCEICGDYFMPNVDSEETLYYCGNCREEA